MASGTITKVLPTSGTHFCKMPDGTMMVWGNVAFGASDYAKSIVPASSTDGTLFTSLDAVLATSDTNEITVSSVINAVNSITLSRRPLSACNMRWLAIGRWK